MRDTHTEREAETQAEGEAGSMQETPCGTGSGTRSRTPSQTPSWDSRIMPWAKAGAKPLSHPGIPTSRLFCSLLRLEPIQIK